MTLINFIVLILHIPLFKKKNNKKDSKMLKKNNKKEEIK